MPRNESQKLDDFLKRCFSTATLLEADLPSESARTRWGDAAAPGRALG